MDQRASLRPRMRSLQPRASAAVLASTFAVLFIALSACSDTTTPTQLLDYHLSHVTTSLGRGGRAVAVDVDPVNPSVAIAAAEQGGLFRTVDGGASWTRLDALPSPNISDARFVPGDHQGQTIIVTAQDDLRLPSDAGIWVSTDGGTSWSRVLLPAPCSQATPGLGIGFDPQSNDVLVGTQCGLVISHDLAAKGSQASWSLLFANSTTAVVVEPGTKSIDICADGPQGHGLYISSPSGVFTFASSKPDCQSVFSLAVSPINTCTIVGCIPTAIFATFGGTVIQSNDGGASWTDLMAAPYNERPIWVRTERTDTLAFSVYVPGEVAACGLQPSTWSCPINGWRRVPASSLNHDMNDIAFSPTGSCPQFMALDFGVVRADPAGSTACTDGSAWQLSGTDASGFQALQIYNVAGELNRSVDTQGRVVPINTNLYVGTQDNHLLYSPDGGTTWQDLAGGASEGFGVESPLFTVSGDPDRSGVTFVTCAHPCNTYRVQQTGQALGSELTWPWFYHPKNDIRRGCFPPPPPHDLATDTPPTVLVAGQYLQWSRDGTTLYLSVNNGCTWSAIATIPPFLPHLMPSWQMQVSGASTADPTIYDMGSYPRTWGELFIKVTHFKDPNTGVPVPGSITALNIRNQRRFRAHCEGFVCLSAYGVDPANANHVIVADFAADQMQVSQDGGSTWQPDTALTQLVTANGAVAFFDQPRVIAFDPLHPNLVLVGTEQAGIIASTDGGRTWTTIPDSQQLTNITSFFFDDLHGVVYVSTFSRGLWRFNWTNGPI